MWVSEYQSVLIQPKRVSDSAGVHKLCGIFPLVSPGTLWAVLTLLAILKFHKVMIPTTQDCGKIKLHNTHIGA